MNAYSDKTAFIGLVDDDRHSVQLLTKMLLAHGAPHIEWLGDQASGHAAVTEMLSDPAANWPTMLIVDLKADSQASVNFLRSIQPLAHKSGVSVVAMVPPGDADRREEYEDAGAAAIFYRHAETAAYRREAASLVSFWARAQRLDAVGM